jgi:hypothetical protein
MLVPQWLVSIVAGAIGGLFDGLLSQGFAGPPGHRSYDGRIIMERIVMGAAAGVTVYGLNNGTFDAAAQLGTSIFSFVTGLAGSDYIRRLWDDRQLREASRSLNRGTADLFETIEEMGRSEGETGEDQP